MSDELLGYAKTIVQLLRTATELENNNDKRAAEVYTITRDYTVRLLQKLDEIVGEQQ